MIGDKAFVLHQLFWWQARCFLFRGVFDLKKCNKISQFRSTGRKLPFDSLLLDSFSLSSWVFSLFYECRDKLCSVVVPEPVHWFLLQNRVCFSSLVPCVHWFLSIILTIICSVDYDNPKVSAFSVEQTNVFIIYLST